MNERSFACSKKAACLLLVGIVLLISCAVVYGQEGKNAEENKVKEDIPRDYYEVLGVDRTASAQEIKAAYRRLSLKWHPDRNPGASEEASRRFVAIARAYEVLSDPQKRARYDKYGMAGEDDPNGAEMDAEVLQKVFKHAFEVFAETFGNLGDIFEGMKIKVGDSESEEFSFDTFDGADMGDFFGNIAEEIRKAKQDYDNNKKSDGDDKNVGGNLDDSSKVHEKEASSSKETKKDKPADEKVVEQEDEDEYVYEQSPDFEGMKIKRKISGLYDKSPVHVLSRDNFDKLMYGTGLKGGDDMWLVLFYHRKAWNQATDFSRSFIKLANSLHDIAALGAVDCASSKGQPLCNKYDITSYPTLLLFNYDHAQPVKFSPTNKDAPISINELDKWVVSQIPDRVHRVTDGNLREFIERTTPFIRALLFSKRSEPTPLLKTIAMKLRGKAVVAIVDPAQSNTLAEFSVTKTPTLVAVFSGADTDRYNIYEGENTFSAISKYLVQMYEFDTETLDSVDKAELRETAEFIQSHEDADANNPFMSGDKTKWNKDDEYKNQKQKDEIVAPPVQELTRYNFEDSLMSVRTAVVYFTPGGKVTPSTREFLRQLAVKYAKKNVWIFWADGTKMARFHDHFPQPNPNSKSPCEVIFINPSANKYFWAEQQLENIDASFDRWIDGDARWNRYEVLPTMADLFH